MQVIALDTHTIDRVFYLSLILLKGICGQTVVYWPIRYKVGAMKREKFLLY